jgi:hypothetical protein
MHQRNQIIKNQKTFSHEIKKWLKQDFNNSIYELEEIETKDNEINEAKKLLEKRFEKIKIEKEINKFFINENNIYPKFYAWWDHENQKAEIFLYENKQKRN